MKKVVKNNVNKDSSIWSKIDILFILIFKHFKLYTNEEYCKQESQQRFVYME